MDLNSQHGNKPHGTLYIVYGSVHRLQRDIGANIVWMPWKLQVDAKTVSNSKLLSYITCGISQISRHLTELKHIHPTIPRTLPVFSGPHPRIRLAVGPWKPPKQRQGPWRKGIHWHRLQVTVTSLLEEISVHIGDVIHIDG